MAGTYTNIAKRRVEQIENSKEAVSSPIAQENTPSVETQKPKEATPLPEKKVKKKMDRKQISALLYMNDYRVFHTLYQELNPFGENIEKGELVGIALSTLSQLLKGKKNEYANAEELRNYVQQMIENFTKQ
jgi:hypothetical protein